ncbi:MAG: bifunctional transcriptional activator/DNA repair enzyme AdaA [Kiloniellales bacterium]
MTLTNAATSGERAPGQGKKAPESASGGGRAVKLVARACAFIEARSGEPPRLAEVAAAVGASPWQLHRAFRRVLGLTPRDYTDAKRAHRFRDELKSGESVAGATYGAGYGSSSRVYEGARHYLGMTPASYARGGKGAEIVYALSHSPMGRLLVAATANGVCFVSLGKSDKALTEALEEEFPEAQSIARDSQALEPAIAALLDYLAGKTPHPDLPLDVRATAFQRRVWQELIAVPPGETRTYSEIAKALGLPKAQRAVGRACATNPVSLVVPCHRILRGDGKLGGYRWGLTRKAALIELEARLKESQAD